MLSLIVPSKRTESVTTLLDSLYENTSDAELILVSEEAGFAEKLNKGIEQAVGDYLIFLHDDAEVTPGWTDSLPEHVGSFCLGENNDSFETWGGFTTPPAYCTDPRLTPDYSYWLCVSREAMDKIGPFDEKFTEPMFQDCDMGLTVRKAGFSIECLPGKIIHHNGEGSGTPDERQRGYLNRKWGICL